MDIGEAICHRVGRRSVESGGNEVRDWMYQRLGDGRPWDGRVIASIINSLFAKLGLGEIECVVTQLAELWMEENPSQPAPAPPVTKPSRRKAKRAVRRRSPRK